MFLNQSCQALARTLWGGVIVFLLFNGMLLGQTNTASIGGTVKDSSGAPVPGATVVVQNTATGVQQQSRTNDAGVYSVRQLQPGTYSVSISHTGFGTINNPALTLEIGQVANLSVTLSVTKH